MKILRRDFEDYDNLRRFISYYYQIDTVKRYCTKTDSILEIGVGNKTVNTYLKRFGYDVTSLDILNQLEPDVVGNVKSLPFTENAFDIVLLYEVLEHLMYKDFKITLRKVRNVAKRLILISLPYWNASFETLIKFPGLGKYRQPPFFRLHFEVPYFFRKLNSSEHHFEIGANGYPLRMVRKDIVENTGRLLEEFSVPINNHHRFFVCEVGA